MGVERGKIHEARMRKQWDIVESYARRLLAREPANIHAIQLIGEALEKQGQVEEALLYYEKALEIDSEEQREVGHTFFLKRLDIIYNRAGSFEDSFRVCEYYTKRHPNGWDAWNRLRRAASKTGRASLSSYAKDRADEIKSAQETAKSAKEIRHQRWRALYEEKLREMGFEPRSALDEPLEAHEPSPSLDAPDEEWGKWLQQTTDLEKIEAEIQAGLSALAELGREERQERLGPPHKMTPEERHRLIVDELTRLKTGSTDTIIFSDRSMPDNYVQLTEKICEVASRAWPGSEMPPLDKTQEDALIALGFSRPGDSDPLANCAMSHLNLSVGQLADIVNSAFEILGSCSHFEMVIG